MRFVQTRQTLRGDYVRQSKLPLISLQMKWEGPAPSFSLFTLIPAPDWVPSSLTLHWHRSSPGIFVSRKGAEKKQDSPFQNN